MGFEFWFNGVQYDYASLKTVLISVDKHDLEHGDMLEHTVIKIETRNSLPIFEQERIARLETENKAIHDCNDVLRKVNEELNNKLKDSNKDFEEVKESDLPELEEIKDEPSGVETGENSASGEPATPDMENPGVFKHSPSNTPEDIADETSKDLPIFHGPAKNLQECVVDEMRRNRKLLEEYKKLGPVGEFGASVVENAITIGEEALKTGDAIEMIRAYNTLKETK